MAEASSVLEIPKMTGIGDARYRAAEADGWRPPVGTRIISADSHWLEGDIWIERFPDTKPPARSAHSMTYDSTRNRVRTVNRSVPVVFKF